MGWRADPARVFVGGILWTPMLLLILPSFAATYSLPVRATTTEHTFWGEDPVMVDDVLTATVAVSNPATGVKFATSGELLLREKTGQGVGELQFGTNPSGSLHTWAITLLDGDGKQIGAAPQIVDVLFGDNGDAAIVARDQANIIIKQVRIKKKNPRVGQDDGNYDVTLTVQGVGTDAAYVGIEELGADRAPLAAHTDMRGMTADVYASYEALLLDAIVPLDTWSVTVDGTLLVDDLSVTQNKVEGGADLDFDVSFWGRTSEKAAFTPLSVVQYAKKTTPKKPKAETTTLGEISALAALKLLPADESPDSYDASVEIILEGDARGYEIGALLTPVGDAPPPLTSELLALSPSDLAIGGSATFAFTSFPTTLAPLTGAITPVGEGGIPLADGAECTFTPTRLSVTKGGSTARYVGECLRDDEGLERVRGVTLSLDSSGVGTVSVELLGLDWQKATAIDIQIDGKSPAVATIQANAAVTETSFELGWSFAADADEADYTVEVLFFGATSPADFSLAGGGLYAWETDEDATWSTEVGADGSTVTASFSAKPRRAAWRTLNVEEHKDNSRVSSN